VLSTPLTPRSIVHGQARALWRYFGAPMILCIALQAGGAGLAQFQTMQQMRSFTPPAARARTGATNAAGTNVIATTNMVTVSVPATPTRVSIRNGDGEPPLVLTVSVVAITHGVTALANLFALAWFGMWMGMTSKNASIATLKTLAFVQLIPWMAIGFASMMLTMLFLVPRLVKKVGNPAIFFTWYPLINAAMLMLLSVGKDAAFVIWSRRKLHRDLRAQACGLRSIRVAAPSTPPALPPSVATPELPMSA
jgi:hypothetical protein